MLKNNCTKDIKMNTLLSIATVHVYILLVIFVIGIIGVTYTLLVSKRKEKDKRIKHIKKERDLLLFVILLYCIYTNLTKIL